MKFERFGKSALKKSSVVKRSISLDGHKTSISLEEDFWTALQEISAVQGIQTKKVPCIVVTVWYEV
jgi:predicted DNA-binding ribbon-helix-helix protein